VILKDDMTEQPGLFDSPPPHVLVRSGDPLASWLAAHTVKAGELEQRVWNVLRKFPTGATSDEVRDLFPPHTPYSSVTARYKSLVDKGLVVIVRDHYDNEVMRPGHSGKLQRVMMAVLP